jgi:hypothetical protein
VDESSIQTGVTERMGEEGQTMMQMKLEIADVGDQV